MENNQQYKSLVQMECSPVLSEAAIITLKSQDISALLDWISEHSEEEEKWKAWLQQRKQGGEIKQENVPLNQTIDHLVNKQMSEQLQKMGFSKNVAQKALLFSNNVSISSAQKWIDDHKYDPDFEEEAFLEQEDANKPKLTPEEAKQKLKELTEKARAIKKQKEEEEAREREKMRVKSGKQMTEAKRLLEEQAMKRKVQLDRIQKARDETYKKQLLEQMRRQKNQKLGKSQDTGKPIETVAAKKQIKYTKIQQLEIQCEQVKVGMHAYPEKAKTFFQTALIYVSNIIKNNGEEKFRKINKENKAFQSRVAEVFAGLQTLSVIGYVEENGFLILKDFDLKQLQGISNLLQRYISYY